MKLNLCSGKTRFEGFINADLDPNGSDVVCDARKLPFKNEVFDTILLIHTLEHFNTHHAWDVLVEIRRVLKRGGRLHIEFPDIFKAMDAYRNDRSNLVQALWGDINNKDKPGWSHLSGWTEDWIIRDIRKLGYRDVFPISKRLHRNWERDTAVIAIK